ncbi:unnamed protein product [Vitrella brassicaformis CCMP3155]|uniref:Uncharacterized protein n=1 Tax=Vitrella brassicaformis (strain CCMP3155) TaxID=1169540 RepID=A0A0G4F1Z8_VITBC|nr:unnamed protein product [Vitrella brassicaformis CCMP3155]|eukprot:CEM05554.1 unnamed protein product [Vitrella brassicaformis CCMP3155]
MSRPSSRKARREPLYLDFIDERSTITLTTDEFRTLEQTRRKIAGVRSMLLEQIVDVSLYDTADGRYCFVDYLSPSEATSNSRVIKVEVSLPSFITGFPMPPDGCDPAAWDNIYVCIRIHEGKYDVFMWVLEVYGISYDMLHEWLRCGLERLGYDAWPNPHKDTYDT